jgi:Putative beta-barrel porin-2, OmpL-like. bbp2
MRTKRTIATLGGAVALVLALGVCAARAEEAAAPTDPTRGQWDSFLDPLRDFEDEYVTGTQKTIEDATGIHVGAAIQKGWTYDFNHPPSGTALPYDGFLYHSSPSLDAAQLSFARPSEGWFVPGFGVKLDFGKIARRIKSDWGGNPGVVRGDTFETNNFDAEEAYLTWAVPEDGPSCLKGLTVKGGKFVTLLGAEVIEPWLNFNNSRSILFGYAIPATNTGVLLSYPITDKISVTGGPVVGWDNVETNNNGWSGMANLTWVATDQVTLSANAIGGPSQNNNVGKKRVVGDFIATYKPLDPLTLQLNYDYGHEDGAALDGGNASWSGMAGIVSYAFSDRFTGSARLEYFNDTDGARSGLKQTMYEWTATAKYLVTQHLYALAEFRQDFSNHDAFQAGHTRTEDANPLVGVYATYVFN